MSKLLHRDSVHPEGFAAVRLKQGSSPKQRGVGRRQGEDGKTTRVGY